jgi:hypothetical protein
MLIGGLLLLIVPAFIFAVWFSFTQFIVILEGKRGAQALQASREFVTGKFWKTFFMIFGGIFLLLFGYSILLSILMSLISALKGINLVDMLTGPLPLWIQILESVGEVFFLPLIVIYLTSVYVELKTNVG